MALARYGFSEQSLVTEKDICYLMLTRMCLLDKLVPWQRVSKGMLVFPSLENNLKLTVLIVAGKNAS